MRIAVNDGSNMETRSDADGTSKLVARDAIHMAIPRLVLGTQ
jgi:hypothetical protein